MTRREREETTVSFPLQRRALGGPSWGEVRTGHSQNSCSSESRKGSSAWQTWPPLSYIFPSLHLTSYIYILHFSCWLALPRYRRRLVGQFCKLFALLQQSPHAIDLVIGVLDDQLLQCVVVTKIFFQITTLTNRFLILEIKSLLCFLIIPACCLPLQLRGKVNISQLHGEIEFNTFLCDKPYNWCI